jgi:hypothetical protein
LLINLWQISKLLSSLKQITNCLLFFSFDNSKQSIIYLLQIQNFVFSNISFRLKWDFSRIESFSNKKRNNNFAIHCNGTKLTFI